MGRKQTIELAREEAMERVAAATVSKLLVLAPPWASLGVLAALAAISHAKWGTPPAVSWAAMAGTLATVVLTGLTWAVSHQRGMLGRVHSTLTTLFAGMWFTVATITGVGQDVTLAALFFGGLTIGVGWNIRAVIRQHNPEDAAGGPDPLANLFKRSKESFGLGGANARTREVSDHKIRAKLQLPAGAKVADDAIKKTAYIESGMQLPPGSVQITANEDRADEATMVITDPRVTNRPIPWPGPSRPGASIAEPCRIALFQDSDPAEPVLTGASYQIMGGSGSGKSMGGAWNLCGEAMTRHDVALFGVDLSKGTQTFGPMRPALHRLETTKAGATAFIRALHAEIPKRTQWLADHGYNDWEPGCGLAYWLIFFEEVGKLFDVLGSKDEERVEQIVKEIRSAGGRVIMSLQKSIFSEMPTIVRSQLAMMCFGLTNGEDAQYGLSERQQRADVSPEMWGVGNPKHVGKAFLDAPGIDDGHATMPLRTYMWGTTAREAVAAMSEHAEQWPASAKVVDEFTAAISDPAAVAAAVASAAPAMAAVGGSTMAVGGRGGSDTGIGPSDDEEAAEAALERLAAAAEHVIATGRVSPAALRARLGVDEIECARLLEALERKGVISAAGPGGHREVVADAEDAIEEILENGDPVTEYVRTADPSPDLTAGSGDEVPDLTGDPVEPDEDDEPRKLSPAASRRVLCDWLRERHTAGRSEFRVAELQAVLEETGNSRAWAYKACNKLQDDGALERTAKGFAIVDVDQLDETHDGATAEL